MRFLLAAGAIVLLLWAIPEAEASHLRGGTLYWEGSEDSNEVTFFGVIYERLSFGDNQLYGEGSIVPGDQTLSTGEGNVAFLRQVLFRNDAQDWLAFSIVDPDTNDPGVSWTYSSPTNGGDPWLASYFTSARIGEPAGHMNNAGAGQLLQTAVRLDDAEGSKDPRGPRILFPPIMQCERDALCQFMVPAAHYEGQFRFSTPQEATNAAGNEGFLECDGLGRDGWIQPCGAELDAVTGTYTWNTTGQPENAGGPTYYSTQIMIEDRQGKSPMDFFIEIVDELPDKPVWVVPPSPCGQTLVVEEGGSITMEARAKTDTGNGIITVDLLGGPTGLTRSYAAGNPGSMTVTWNVPVGAGDEVFVFLAVGSSGGQSDPCGVTVDVRHNEPPLADFDWTSSSPSTQTPFSFNDRSTDPDGTVVAWSWDFDNDDLADSTEQFPTWTFATKATHPVTLTAIDNQGKSGSVTKDVVITNTAPQANFTYPSGLQAGADGQFTDKSTDPEGDALTWSWDFGDGATSTQQHPTHSFAKAGGFTVCLTATDIHGVSDETCKFVPVENQLPVVAIVVQPSTPAATTELKYGFLAEASDADGEVVSYEWSFGDGDQAISSNVQHAFDTTGTFTVQVTVTDDLGGKASANVDVEITNNRPVARFSFFREDGDATNTVRFTSESHDVETANLIHEWDYEEGISADPNPLVAFTDAERLYHISLTVEDAEGAPSTYALYLRPADLFVALDSDGDGISDDEDVCPTISDPEQTDSDGDGIGDACDNDRDGDGVNDQQDLYPDDPNEDHDHDGDGIGDNADTDDDGDGIDDETERNLGLDGHNPDTDGDGIYDGAEIELGSDPKDPLSPSFAPTELTIDVVDERTRISWIAKDDARVEWFHVYHDGVLIASVRADGPGQHRIFVETPANGTYLVIAELDNGLQSTAPPAKTVQAAPPPPAKPDVMVWPWVLGAASLAGILFAAVTYVMRRP